MNKAYLIGRLTADPEVRYSADGRTEIANYTLAVDRRKKKGEEAKTDFIRCTAFSNNAEFARNYLNKGMKIAVVGHIQTGYYMNSNNVRVNTFDVIIEEQEFCENKRLNNYQTPAQTAKTDDYAYAEENDEFVYAGNEEDLPFD